MKLAAFVLTIVVNVLFGTVACAQKVQDVPRNPEAPRQQSIQPSIQPATDGNPTSTQPSSGPAEPTSTSIVREPETKKPTRKGSVSHSGKIMGQILTHSGKPLPGVNVVLLSPLTGVSRSTLSDKAGNYRFVGVVAADYLIQVQMDGKNVGDPENVKLDERTPVRRDLKIN
jgi:Carboxypeptidase regulatory-like domain